MIIARSASVAKAGKARPAISLIVLTDIIAAQQNTNQDLFSLPPALLLNMQNYTRR